MKRFFLSFILILIFLANTPTLAHQKPVFNNIFSVQKSQINDVIYLKVRNNLPENINKQRKISLAFMKPYFKTNAIKIVVVWQLDEYSYGKTFALSRVYIQDFLNKKSSDKNLSALINVDEILPLSNRYNIQKVPQNDIAKENLIRSAELKKTADLYYLEGKIFEAQRLYLQCLQFNPYDYVSMFRLGEIFKNQNVKARAEQYFVKSLEINPEFSAADKALCEIRKIN